MGVGLHLAIHILSLIYLCSFVRLMFPFLNALIHALPRIIANGVSSALHLGDFHFVLLLLNKLGSTHLISVRVKGGKTLWNGMWHGLRNDIIMRNVIYAEWLKEIN